jgi:transposase, IS5 family
MKAIQKISFADMAVAQRKIKFEFFAQIAEIVDFRSVSNLINKHYLKGMSATGKPAYEGLLLFKMCLLQTWYGLSDYEVEAQLNDSISFSKFCGLSLDKVSPDHSTLSRFRSEMTKAGVFEKLFKQINKQLERHKIIVKTGAIVDASIIDSPLKPKGKPLYEIAVDREDRSQTAEELAQEKQEIALMKKISPGVDTEARWVKKAGKLRYGYKKHVVTDEQGLMLGVLTTSANVNEITNLAAVLGTADLPQNIPLKGDKGYQSKKNEELLIDLKLKNHILKKAKKNKPLTAWETKFNKLVGKTRFKIERTFGGVKRWFNANCARYRGLEKMHTQNLMEAIAYNLYRSPGIIMSKPLN